MFGNYNGFDFYVRCITVFYTKIAVGVLVMQLDIIYALRKQMSLRFEMRENLKFTLRSRRI